MTVRDDRSDVKQTTAGFRGPLMVQSLTSAKSKFLSLEVELKEIGVSLDEYGYSPWVKDKDQKWCKYSTITYITKNEKGYGNVEKIYESEVSRTGADGKVVFGVTKVLLLKYFQI